MPRKSTQPDPEKLAFWRAKMDEQRSSTLSQAEFCRQNGLTENTFSFWKGIIFPDDRQHRTRKERRKKVFSPHERTRLVKKWEKSGLTQAEFCRKEQIFEWQFSDWKNRMKREAEKARPEDLKEANFVEVEVTKQKMPIQKNASLQAGLRKNQPGKSNASRVIAMVEFSGGSISILSDAGVIDLKNIVTAVAECARDWSE